jgi:hypothetical protein
MTTPQPHSAPQRPERAETSSEREPQAAAASAPEAPSPAEEAAPPDELREQLRSRLCPLLEEAGLADEFDACSGVEVLGLGGLGEQAGLTAELINRSLPWDRWDPQRRRLARRR